MAQQSNEFITDVPITDEDIREAVREWAEKRTGLRIGGVMFSAYDSDSKGTVVSATVQAFLPRKQV